MTIMIVYHRLMRGAGAGAGAGVGEIETRSHGASPIVRKGVWPSCLFVRQAGPCELLASYDDDDDCASPGDEGLDR